MAQQPREDLLFKHKSKGDKDVDSMRIIMRFSQQHRQIREIIQNHWSIHTDDYKVQQFLPDTPSITFRRASSLKDELVKSEYHKKPNKKHSLYGTYPCGHCAYCPLIRKKNPFFSQMAKALIPNILPTVHHMVLFI